MSISARAQLTRGSFWRKKDEHQYVMKVIGTAIEGGAVTGAIVMYEQQGTDFLSYNWTTVDYFLEHYEPDPNFGWITEEPVGAWFLEE